MDKINVGVDLNKIVSQSVGEKQIANETLLTVLEIFTFVSCLIIPYKKIKNINFLISETPTAFTPRVITRVPENPEM